MPFTPMPLNGGELTWDPQPDDYIVTNAAAAQIQLPSPGYRLVKIQVVSGTSPAHVAITPDGITQCYFPAGSNATNGIQAWALTWPIPGTIIPSSVFTYSTSTGGLSAVVGATFTFSKGRSKGPPILNYRSVPVNVSGSGAVSTVTNFTAATYNVAPAVPKGVMAFSSAAAGGAVFYWPAIGAAQSGHPCDTGPGGIVTIGTAPPLPKATTITPGYTELATTKIVAYIGYDPV
jgi:hypothetical protein